MQKLLTKLFLEILCIEFLQRLVWIMHTEVTLLYILGGLLAQCKTLKMGQTLNMYAINPGKQFSFLIPMFFFFCFPILECFRFMKHTSRPAKKRDKVRPEAIKKISQEPQKEILQKSAKVIPLTTIPENSLEAKAPGNIL